MSRPRRPGKGGGYYMASGRGGGSSGGGELGSYKLNPDYKKKPGDIDYRYKGDPSELSNRKYLDDRGFWSRLTGDENTAESLNLGRAGMLDASEIELDSNKALVEYTRKLEEQLAAEKANKEAEITTLANQSLVTDRAPGTVSELNPVDAKGPYDRQVPLNNETWGKVLPRIQELAKGRQITSESLLGSEKADFGRSELDRNKGTLLDTSSANAKGGLLDAQRGLKPEVQGAKDRVAVESLLKSLDLNVGPGQTVYRGGGGMATGMTEQQDVIPGDVIGNDPKTGQPIRRDPTTVRRQIPGQMFPALNNSLIEQILKGQQSVSPYGTQGGTTVSPAPAPVQGLDTSAAFNLDNYQGMLGGGKKVSAPTMKGGVLSANITDPVQEEQQRKIREIQAIKKLQELLAPYRY